MSERRIAWLFVTLLTVQLVLLASRAPAPAHASGESLLAATGLRLVAPLGRLVGAVGDGLGSVRAGIRLRRTLLEENRVLHQEVERLRLERVRLGGLEREVEHLAEALAEVRQRPGELRPAQVVYLDQKSWLQTMVIYSGKSAEEDQPVLTSTGLVGRVVKVVGPYARVEMLSHPDAGVGAMLESSRRQGVVRGAGGGRLELDYISRQTEVALGERVLTAGIDGVYPAGILIGTVASVVPGDELSHHIEVAPAVDFPALRQVFLLDRPGFPDELRPAGEAP
ncbi:MAG TPA: rod shape-determining protein MreC [Thermoanaerobaculia bacterium]|nr:rod shape-determining protein MreC [Thermoanaerobaculia bacterium]